MNELIHLVEENNCQGIYGNEHNQLGECGRDRIYVTYYVKCIKFWFKIVTSENSLIKSCHLGLCTQVELGKINWATMDLETIGKVRIKQIM